MGPGQQSTPSVYAIVGDDAFLRQESLQSVLKPLEPEMGALGPVQIDGSQCAVAEVLDELRTPSLLGGRRVVVVDHAGVLISNNRDILERYCDSPELESRLILLCDSLPRNTKLHRIIAQKGQIVMCESPRGQALAAWIAARAQRVYGKRIATPAGQMLRRLLGDSPGWIDAELSKLAAFVGERPEITSGDVEELTDNRREEKVFAVVDAMANGNASLALQYWEQVLATDRAAPGRAIGGLAYAIRQLLEAHRELAATGSVFGASKRTFTDPATLKKRLQGLPASRIIAWQRGLLEAEVAVKTGLSGLELAIEQFIIKSISKPQTARAG